MNQITTRYVTENGACYEQYVITDAEAKTELVITPERGGMITGFSLNGEEYIWTRHPNFSECNRPRFGVPVLFPNCGLPDNGVHIFDGKAYPMENHGFADLCAWDVESVGPDGVTLILESTPLTKFLYPFDFTVLMNYNLEGNTAAINITVINEGDTNMPFSFGQLPSYRVPGDKSGERWARLRQSQLNTARTVPHTAMVVTADCGDAENIHPKNKYPVGMRFAAAAEELVYGGKEPGTLTLPGPVTVEGHKVTVPVGGIRDGLTSRSRESGFELRDTEGNWHKADFHIRNNLLKLSSAEVLAPTGVRYAWGNVNTLTIYHKSGLPLPPFTFDTELKTMKR